MRTGRRERLAVAACIPLTLLALSACGPGENKGSGDTASPSSSTASSPGEAEGGTGETGTEEGDRATGEPAEAATDLPEDEPEPQGPDGEGAAAATVLTYDASEASEFSEPIALAAAAWNESLKNVEIRPAKAGEPAKVQIVTGDGWPEASTGPAKYGQGQITMGRRAFDEGHSTPRVAAHEFGHILGLDDRRDQGCSSLMSGHKGGNDCPSWHPDAYEKRRADANFAQK